MKTVKTLFVGLVLALTLPAAAALAGEGRSGAAAVTFVDSDELGTLVEKRVVPAWRAELRAEMRTWPGRALRKLLERSEPVRLSDAPATGSTTPAAGEAVTTPAVETTILASDREDS